MLPIQVPTTAWSLPMARPGSAGLLLATALIALCASRTPAAGAARHDAAPPSYKLLTVIPLGGSSHTFDLVAVAGTLANRCARGGLIACNV
jgi:hypothetical protein